MWKVHLVKKREAYIQLVGHRLVLARFGPDGALHHATAPITLNQEPGQWVKDLSRQSAVLRELAEKLDVAGASASVFYISPMSAMDVESLPVRSAAQAAEAARLSCLETVSYPGTSAACQTLLIGRDGAGEERRTHVAVAVERNDALSAIAQFVEDAGLVFNSAVPIDAPIMAQLAASGLREDEPVARLYIGEHSSMFFISGRRSLHFSRRLGLGIESLINVLTRPIRVRSDEEPVTLSEEQVRDILQTHGIPDRDTIIHDDPELRGMQIIPVLQPVLQRIVVELRQSLRFSLPEDMAETVPIHCLGPGSHVPGLATVIAEELGVPLTENDAGGVNGTADHDGATAQDIGLLADAVRDRAVVRDFALLPLAHICQRHRRKLQRWIWAGAAAALVMVAVDGMRHHFAVESLSEQKANMLSHHSELDAFQRTSATLANALSEMSNVEQRVQAELREHFDGYAALAELAHITPETIHLKEITFRQTDDGVTGTIHGLARHDEDKQTALKAYVEQIRRSPLFAEAVLGNVQVSRDSEGSGEQFEAILTLLPLLRPEQVESASGMTASAASTDGGDE